MIASAAARSCPTGAVCRSRPRRDGGQDRVERTAIADVAQHAADAGQFHRRIEFGGERRDAVERDAGATIGDVDRDRTARAFEDEVGAAIAQRDAAGGDRPAAERDRRVAAHGAEAGVVHEQRAKRRGRGGGDDEGAVHLGVSARFQHQAAAVEIEACRGVVALLQDGGPAGFREAVQDETHRLAAGVHLDRAVGGDGVGGEIGPGAVGRSADRGFVDNAPGLDLDARFRAEGCPRG